MNTSCSITVRCAAVILALAMLSLASAFAGAAETPRPGAAAGAPVVPGPRRSRRRRSFRRSRQLAGAAPGMPPFSPRRRRCGDRNVRLPLPADSSSRPLKSTVAALHELSPWSMFLSADILVKAVMIGLAFASLVTWTIFIAKMVELSVVAAQTARGARQDQRCQIAGGGAIRARRQGQRVVVVAGGGDARGAAVGGNFQRRRHQGAGGIELCRDRARRSAPDPARHGSACHHRRDLAVRRAVRHGVGHHEQLYRHLEIADHQSCRGGARHRRSAARHRVRSGRGDPGGHHLQSFLAGDQRLP